MALEVYRIIRLRSEFAFQTVVTTTDPLLIRGNGVLEVWHEQHLSSLSHSGAMFGGSVSMSSDGKAVAGFSGSTAPRLHRGRRFRSHAHPEFLHR